MEYKQKSCVCEGLTNSLSKCLYPNKGKGWVNNILLSSFTHCLVLVQYRIREHSLGKNPINTLTVCYSNIQGRTCSIVKTDPALIGYFTVSKVDISIPV